MKREPGVFSWWWSPPWRSAALLVAAVVLCYWNSLGAPFLFDDAGAIAKNPTIRHLASFAVLHPPANGSTTTNRPVLNLSFAVNYALSGEGVWSYHALNVAIHAWAALVLLGIVRRTLSGAALRERFGAAAPSLAFLIALLWALHPLQTETVVCIAQRTESLWSLFFLLTLYGFIRGVEADRSFCRSLLAGDGPHVPSGVACQQAPTSADRESTHACRWLSLSFLSCLLGMGTKEVMVTAPLLVLLYDRTFVAGRFSAAWRQRRTYYVALGQYLAAARLDCVERRREPGARRGLRPRRFLVDLSSEAMRGDCPLSQALVLAASAGARLRHGGRSLRRRRLVARSGRDWYCWRARSGRWYGSRSWVSRARGFS